MHDFLNERKRYYSEAMDNPGASEDYIDEGRYEVTDGGFANLTSSELSGYPRLHMPSLDLDFEAHLEPSTTPGHFHLYLNKAVSWEAYVKLLDALFDAGLIEYGFWHLSKERGGSFLRYPGHKKVKR